MSGDSTVIVTPNGSQWRPASGVTVVRCTHCDCVETMPDEDGTYPGGTCPDCGHSWTGTENVGAAVSVAAPQQIVGG